MGNYKQTKLFTIIKQEINKIDVYSLLESGCPKDEFDIESKMIYDKLSKGMNINQIATIMCDVFCEMFNDIFNIEMFMGSAEVIEIELNK